MALLLPAADAIRSRTAGVKGEADKVKNRMTTEVPVVRGVVGDFASDLHLTGGPHPESVPAVISHALARGTDAVRGPHGGLITQPGAVTAPGPAGGVNAAASGLGAAGTPGAGQANR